MSTRSAGVPPAGPAASRRRTPGAEDGARPSGVDAGGPRVSDWMVITQDLVNRFAEVTGDQQWIHTDPERGATIAHGFLTLSLFSKLLRQTARLEDVRMAVNYGLDRVRFIAPVMVGSRIRGRFERASSEERADGTKTVWHVTIESDASEKLCCVADWIVLYVR
ncbi:MAG: MaoC family dehydratase [Acidobacteriota bacterium]